MTDEDDKPMVKRQSETFFQTRHESDMRNLNPYEYGGVVLDEYSITKSLTSVTLRK